MKVQLKNATLSMPYVFRASAFDANSEEKFSAHFIIERGSENERIMKDAISQEAAALWKGNAPAKLKAILAAGKMWCLRDGDTKLDKSGDAMAGYSGKLFVSAKNTVRPLILGSGPDGRSPVVEADGKMYPGAVVNAIIDVKVNNMPSDQSYAYLLGVQFVRDGERLAGGPGAVSDDFEAIPQEAGAAAPATGAASLF